MREKGLLLVAALLVVPRALAEDATAAAHAAVREALLEQATVATEHLDVPEHETPRRADEHAARARQEEAERAAHARAAGHAARHARDAHPGHAADSPTPGSMHHSAAGGGEDSTWDCHDAAEHKRTRDTHDGESTPEHEPPHGP